MGVPGESKDEGNLSSGDGTIHAEFDWSSVEPSTAVVETVAIAADREPTAIESLYDAIDPGALDDLLRSRGGDTEAARATVSFIYAGYQVTVAKEGHVTVRPTSEQET